MSQILRRSRISISAVLAVAALAASIASLTVSAFSAGYAHRLRIEMEQTHKSQER